MHKFVAVAAFAAIGATACAEMEAPTVETAETAAESVRYVESAEVAADDGRVFVVEVGFDGTIAPEIVTDILDNISIVGIDGIAPVDEGPVFDGFAPSHENDIVLLPIQPGLDISLQLRDPDSFVDDTPWYMVQGVDPREIERQYEDACPAWH